MTSPVPRSSQDVNNLLEAMTAQYGYDFSGYAPASLNRRIHRHMQSFNIESVENLKQIILKDEQAFADLLRSLSVPVTEMFRDPPFFKYLREQVLPWLATFPFIKIWHAGCATGEEAWSMAIMLHKAGLLSRSQIYATDYNEEALTTARRGIYDSPLLDTWQRNFKESGGEGDLSDYCFQRYGSLRMDRTLQQHITFANHNLVTDHAFGEMNLVLCRNVLIYFSRDLQNRVLDLFKESILPGGLLCLGPRETMRFSSVADSFEPVEHEWKIYRLKQGFQL
ncbi:protein-glutamate O-methyltransferase CheR [Sansalvadorimonas sp. 2012CJ34-2]|uniref:Protein-glutamate O-methyltransferase CheR n=1 Tax=Parendozoicomonas callyspongiae TaxID=2942213 RepID=A0ABT0PCU5_9GAMM|nr:protein-glutamate O-methyltransferase CheR [Sansalvadorimonas sp. 2012CJ34-2]MCL6269076.1 protein-glutamate O-methyltransferase CheR [Sansalvadorimonas sp. 2012CJ34-2]